MSKVLLPHMQSPEKYQEILFFSNDHCVIYNYITEVSGELYFHPKLKDMQKWPLIIVIEANSKRV